jgi:hypothetical protein
MVVMDAEPDRLAPLAPTDAKWQSYFTAFVQGLRQLGWIEGQNLRIDTRWSAGDATLARIYAAQLIGLTPEVILASSMTNLTAVQQATSTLPVVFIQVTPPSVNTTTTTCQINCDTQAMNCQNSCIPTTGATVASPLAPAGSSTACHLSCTSQQLVCKQRC